MKRESDCKGRATLEREHWIFCAPPEASEPARETSEIPNFQALKGTRVLLCEDHPMNMKVTEKILKEAGIEVERAENGAIAVEAFRTSPPGSIQAILMDIRMPEMDGLTAARTIRAMDRPDAAAVPMIAMTANAFEEDRQMSRDAGMNDHLSKPIDPQELYAALVSAMEKNK